MMPLDEDRESVLRCRQGDTEAFEVLVRKYQKRMLNIAFRMGATYEDACEVVQDAFLSAYRNIGRFEGKSKFSTWLTAIVLNLSRNRLRQTRGAVSVGRADPQGGEWRDADPPADELPSQEPSALERLERREVQEKVQGCIDALASEFREVVVLRDIQGFSYDEIGEMLGLAEGTVKSRLFRARESLRECLRGARGGS